MSVTPEGNLYWISTTQEFEEFKIKHKAFVGEKVIILNPAAGESVFHIYTGEEQWESMK